MLNYLFFNFATLIVVPNQINVETDAYFPKTR